MEKINRHSFKIGDIFENAAGSRYEVIEADKNLKAVVADFNKAKEEAKEIIRELLDTQSRLDPYSDLFKARVLKAEQFLNSEVEK